MTTTGVTHVAELAGGQVRSFEVTPEDAGLARADAAALKGGDAQHNAAALTAVLDGDPGPYRDVAILNAAAALVVAGRAADLRQGAALAAEALASGTAKATLARLVLASNDRPFVAPAPSVVTAGSA